MGRQNQSTNRQKHPAARTNDLSVTVVGDETVVYDQLSHQASCLSAVTAAVWNACDGKNDIDALLQTVRSMGFQDAGDEVILLALGQLEQVKLLEVVPDARVNTANKLSRREMLQSVGLRAVVAIPIVTSISIQPAIAGISATCHLTFCTANFPAGCCSTHPICTGNLCG